MRECSLNWRVFESVQYLDSERNSFQLLNLGWRNEQYYFYVVFHLAIQNGKVWLKENRTDVLIAQILVEQGISKSDIVLGLQSSETMALSGYEWLNNKKNKDLN